MDTGVLKAFETRAAEHVPGFEVRFKDESKFMMGLGFLLSPFNPGFMEHFVTTIGSKVYFPSREHYAADPMARLRTLTHEFVHGWDGERTWLFGMSYLLPQLLAIIPLLVFGFLAGPHAWLLALPLAGYVGAAFLMRVHKALFWVLLVGAIAGTFALAWWLTGWAVLALVAMLVCLAPWPSPWRTKWELRGYSMSVAATWWLTGVYTTEYREHIVKQFVGPSYFFMSWSRSKIEKVVDEAFYGAKELTLLGDPPFKIVHEFFQEHQLIRTT